MAVTNYPPLFGLDPGRWVHPMRLLIVSTSLGSLPRRSGPTQAERVMLVPRSAHWPLTIVHSLAIGVWVVSLLFTGFSDIVISVSRGLACPSAFLPFRSPGIRTPLFWSPWSWHVQAPSLYAPILFKNTITYCI